MKYVKKPVVVDAYQVGMGPIPSWLEFNSKNKHIFESKFDGWNFILHTIQDGRMHASYGDYIIKGIQGEIYPCNKDIFEATYEPFEDPVHYRVSEVTNIIKNGTGDYTVYHKDSIKRAKGTK